MIAVDLIGGGGGGGDSRTPTRTPDTLLSQDYVEVLLAVSEGPIKGLAGAAGHRLENFYVGETPLQNVATGQANFADFATVFYSGADDDTPIEFHLGGQTSNLQVNVRLAQSTPVTRTTPSSLRATGGNPGINQLEIRLNFNQLVIQNDDGTFESTAHFRIQYKATTSGTWLYYNGESDSSVSGKTTSGYVKDFLIPVTPLSSDDYDVRVTKLSPDNGTTEVIEFTWESLQMTSLGRTTFTNVALAHVYGKASNQFSSIPQFSGVYEGLLLQVPTNYNTTARTYDESTAWAGTFKTEYTNNPAWVLYALIMNTRFGLARYYKNVSANMYEFYAASKWCDESVSNGAGGYQPRFTFNDLITDMRSGVEMLQYVAGSFNSLIFDQGNGVIRLRMDKYQAPDQIFTPENVSSEGFSYSFTDTSTRYNDVTVTFVNPDLDYTEDRRKATISNTAYIAANGRIPHEFLAVGCTDVHEAVRRANYRLITANTECATVSFLTSRFGVITEVFNTVYVADPDSDWSSGGRIKSIVGSTINFRDPVYFTNTSPVTMRVQCFDGIHNLTVTPPATGVQYSVTITTGTLPGTIPDRTVFTIEDTYALGVAKPFKVLSIAEEGDDFYRVTALEVNVNKYTDADAGTTSSSVQYSYRTPGVPLAPSGLNVESGTSHLQVNANGTINSRAFLSWVRPTNSATDYFEVDYQEVNSGTWITEKTFDDNIYLSPMKDGVAYDFRLFAVNRFARAAPVYLLAQTIIGKTEPPSGVTGLTVSLTSTGHVANWLKPADLDWDLTAIQTGISPQTWSNSSSLPGQQRAVSALIGWKTAGTYQVLAKHLDTTGNYSVTAASTGFTVLAPAAPVFSRADVEENVLKLQWQDCRTTQPLKRAIYRVGSTSDTYSTATDYGTDGGEQRVTLLVFNTPGLKRVFVAMEDIAGNVTSTSFVDVNITLPTNYVLSDQYASTFSGTITNGVKTDTHLLLLAKPETWSNHFSTNSYSNTGAQVTAGHPLYFEPGDSTASYYETYDLGRVISSSTITVAAQYLWAGSGTITPKISYKQNSGDAYTDVTGSWSAVASTFRYIKITIDVTSDGGANDLVDLTSLITSISLRKITERLLFTSNSSDSTGTLYTITQGILDITSQSFTVNGTGATFTDVIPDDSTNPPTVRVKAWDASVTRVTASGELTITGTA